MWWKKYIKIAIIIIVIGLVGFGIYKLAGVIVDNTYSSRELVKKSDNQEESNTQSSSTDSQDASESESEENSSGTTELSSDVASNSEEYNLEDYQPSNQQVRDDGDINNSAYSKNEYLLRLSTILNREDSPYHSYYNECNATAEDLQDGDKVINISHENSTILSVYCNSIDYAPYMFTKSSPFSEEEDKFFSSLGNGESGEDEGVYYWRYI